MTCCRPRIDKLLTAICPALLSAVAPAQEAAALGQWVTAVLLRHTRAVAITPNSSARVQKLQPRQQLPQLNVCAHKLALQQHNAARAARKIKQRTAAAAKALERNRAGNCASKERVRASGACCAKRKRNCC